MIGTLSKKGVRNLRNRKGGLSDGQVRRLEELCRGAGLRVKQLWNTLGRHITNARGTATCRRATRRVASENLGLWVADQRTAFKKGKLDPERTRRLEAIGIKWRIRQRTNEATREHPRAAL